MTRLGSLAALLALLLAPTLAAPADGATRRMFITSVSGRGNLGDWNDAGAAVGLAAADAICAERAEAFDPEHADEYVAWISSSQDDAWCRVQGLAGKRSDRAHGAHGAGLPAPLHRRRTGEPALASVARRQTLRAPKGT